MLLVALPLAGCSSGGQSTGGTAPAAGAGSDPLVGQSIYVDPASQAARQATRLMASGRSADASAISELARRPTATWIADGSRVRVRVHSLVQRAESAGRTALLVAYFIPGRDCGSYSAGGAGSAAAYRRWVGEFAGGLGAGRAAVILEPDAIPQALQGCLSPKARAERYRLLRAAVGKLSARPDTSVYLDAGNAGWIRPPSGLLEPLRSSGIGMASGFALNVSNYFRTGESIRYGRELSRRLGGAHFVVDTGRNGNGPLGRGVEGPDWCNPPGRALGRDPTTDTGQKPVDAFLWVKEPGTSDGTCRGGPPAGEWWPRAALELARNRP